MRLLVLDAGNTNITAGVFSGRTLARRWRHQTDARISASRLRRELSRGAGVEGPAMGAAIYGSVVPGINRALERAVRAAFGCRVLAVTPRSPLGMKLKVRTPLEVGADRILNALAAFERARGAAVVIDFGTATTFDCVSKTGDYLGGAILPGPRMAAQALARGTAQLPLVEPRRPRRVIGKDTLECLQGGLYYGYLGMIEKVLAMSVAEMRRDGAGGAPRVYATGGLAGLYAGGMPKSVSLAPDLTLEGLRIAYERLSGEGG